MKILILYTLFLLNNSYSYDATTTTGTMVPMTTTTDNLVEALPEEELIDCGYRFIAPITYDYGSKRKWVCEHREHGCRAFALENLYDESQYPCVRIKGEHNHAHNESYSHPYGLEGTGSRCLCRIRNWLPSDTCNSLPPFNIVHNNNKSTPTEYENTINAENNTSLSSSSWIELHAQVILNNDTVPVFETNSSIIFSSQEEKKDEFINEYKDNDDGDNGEEFDSPEEYERGLMEILQREC